MAEATGGTAVVTGAGRGIGRAVALRLAADGHAVVATARSQDEIEETAALITEAGGRALAMTSDISEQASVQAVLDRAVSEFGPVTVLANVAGGGVPGTSGPFVSLDPEAIVRGVTVNLLGAILATRLVLPAMVEAGRGRIINVASGSGMIGQPYIIPYGTSKTGLLRFSEQLALELEGTGVTVFSMTPGNVLSKLTAKMVPVIDDLIADPPVGIPWVYPAGHELEESGWYPPERAAEVISFLASGRADALTGRFFSVHYDEAAITARADEVIDRELYVLRVPTLEGLESSHHYGEHARAGVGA